MCPSLPDAVDTSIQVPLWGWNVSTDGSSDQTKSTLKKNSVKAWNEIVCFTIKYVCFRITEKMSFACYIHDLL